MFFVNYLFNGKNMIGLMKCNLMGDNDNNDGVVYNDNDNSG